MGRWKWWELNGDQEENFIPDREREVETGSGLTTSLRRKTQMIDEWCEESSWESSGSDLGFKQKKEEHIPRRRRSLGKGTEAGRCQELLAASPELGLLFSTGPAKGAETGWTWNHLVRAQPRIPGPLKPSSHADSSYLSLALGTSIFVASFTLGLCLGDLLSASCKQQ